MSLRSAYLIEQPELSVLGLAVGRVKEDASIQNGAVDVCYHAAHIAERLGLSISARELGLLDVPADPIQRAEGDSVRSN